MTSGVSGGLVQSWQPLSPAHVDSLLSDCQKAPGQPQAGQTRLTLQATQLKAQNSPCDAIRAGGWAPWVSVGKSASCNVFYTSPILLSHYSFLGELGKMQNLCCYLPLPSPQSEVSFSLHHLSSRIKAIACFLSFPSSEGKCPVNKDSALFNVSSQCQAHKASSGIY